MIYPNGTDTFTYNGFGQKMGATLEGIARTYAWFGDRLIAEYGCGGCCYAGAIYTDGSYSGLWLGRQMGGQKQYPVYDSIGTVRRVVNENAATLFSNDLDAFGHAIAGSGSATWYPFRFGGAWGYTTMPSGLEQLGARYYWPELGRFIQQDPIWDGMNWYVYAGNNPVTGIDPTGQWDLNIGFEAEVAVLFWGIDIGGGVVFDFDHPSQGGLYGSYGRAVGATAGIGVGVGFAQRDIEGQGYNGDANVLIPSVAVSFDQPSLGAFNGVMVTGGLGVGGAYSETKTSTWTWPKIGEALGRAGRWIKRKLWPC